MAMEKAPVFFISHGGPDLLENKEQPGEFYTWLGQYLVTELKPKAIVIISAHWQPSEKDMVLVDTSEKPSLIYDFYGFPRRYYSETWDQHGSPELAHKVIQLLEQAGINASGEEYGNDHGVWVPLKRAMPSSASIPIVEVSTLAQEDLTLHYKIGQALAPLRESGVVIIGSGSAVHNLYNLQDYLSLPPPSYVKDFDKQMEASAVATKEEERRTIAIALDQHPSYRQCHPSAEHLVPFHIALGAAGPDHGIKLLEGYYARLSWGSYAFGLNKDAVLPRYSSKV